MASVEELLHRGLASMTADRPRLDRLRSYWRGTQPAAFLSRESAESLDKRLHKLSVNFPRLVVGSLAERITLEGFNLEGVAELELTRRWKRAGGDALAGQLDTDRLLYGSSYVTVWAADGGELTVTGDTPFTMAAVEDPATGRTEYAVRRWSVGPGVARAAVYEPDRVTLWQTDGAGSRWVRTGTVDNPLDVVPVVPLVRRVSLADEEGGTSAVEDILELTDANAKILSDSMVTSEYYARPRRWATGLEIEEDEDGNPVDPFGTGRFLQSEDPETKFGQLSATRLDGAADLVATITQQIGALTGLPSHYLGLHGDQPPNADSIRAAEAQLTSRARAEMLSLTRPYARVARLVAAVSEGVPYAATRPDYSPRWGSPEIRTPAQAADTAAKLRSIGVPLAQVLADPMRWEPDRIADAVEEARLEAQLKAQLERTRGER